jgi:hypothetical protein
MIKYKENKGQIKQQSSSCMHYHSNAKANIFQFLRNSRPQEISGLPQLSKKTEGITKLNSL